MHGHLHINSDSLVKGGSSIIIRERDELEFWLQLTELARSQRYWSFKVFLQVWGNICSCFLYFKPLSVWSDLAPLFW